MSNQSSVERVLVIKLFNWSSIDCAASILAYQVLSCNQRENRIPNLSLSELLHIAHIVQLFVLINVQLQSIIKILKSQQQGAFSNRAINQIARLLSVLFSIQLQTLVKEPLGELPTAAIKQSIKRACSEIVQQYFSLAL